MESTAYGPVSNAFMQSIHDNAGELTFFIFLLFVCIVNRVTK